jgi:hypothetical protein
MRELALRVVMQVWPDGGLGTARRNAWAAMAADARRARQRGEVAAYLAAHASAGAARAAGGTARAAGADG